MPAAAVTGGRAAQLPGSPPAAAAACQCRCVVCKAATAVGQPAGSLCQTFIARFRPGLARGWPRGGPGPGPGAWPEGAGGPAGRGQAGLGGTSQGHQAYRPAGQNASTGWWGAHCAPGAQARCPDPPFQYNLALLSARRANYRELQSTVHTTLEIINTFLWKLSFYLRDRAHKGVEG